MSLTDDDKIRAIRISQALQEFFDKSPFDKVLRSSQAYDELLKKNLVERDRHGGIKFRDFLKKLLRHNSLDLIPQLRIEKNGDNWINWFFESAPSKTIKARNLRPISKPIVKPTIDLQLIKDELAQMVKRDDRDFDFAQLGTRKNYPRAYEYWTKREEDLLREVVKEITDPFELSKIFSRQPSAIQTRLITNLGIEI